MIPDNDFNSDLSDIKHMLSDIQSDIRSFMDSSNHQHLDMMVNNVKNDYSGVIVRHLMEDAGKGLEKNMVKKCEMRNDCKGLISNILEKNAGLIRGGAVNEAAIEENRLELKQLRTMVPYDKCDICFAEASDILSRQVTLMRSMRIYETNKDKREDLSLMPPEEVVDNILEPLCHQKRFEILKAISAETKSFSALSKLTGLRGGNLLFHLQKLVEKGMIIQRHERGDYMITGKGFKVMEGVSSIYSALEPETEEQKEDIG
ncbi:winged helix-turn-helix domain-containing protein [Methanolobus sp. WCC1]|jgi:predicted transcriptional regulator|uniref:Transcriptional regulator, ArsR family n=1 Tax=Methanolobus tindarius DSM 2278 TaxID=1090322 RepID=W9DPQ9_METTI|nr:winged helix-turn-helix domain-containing protein [Methanolobus tindarius]ETA67278.1 transcriptional regulator, ArsR family [Methanolobus tindarius DSM 2278]